MVRNRSVRVGMSELALTCSVGSTAVHRTVTQSNVQKQYVYGDGTFAYLESRLNFTVLENNVLYARLHLQHEVTDEHAC